MLLWCVLLCLYDVIAIIVAGIIATVFKCVG